MADTNDTNQAPPGGIIEYMSVADVAAYTGLSRKYWDTLRSTGGGPIYIKPSTKVVRYRKADVDEWMQERLRRSTFDDRQVAA